MQMCHAGSRRTFTFRSPIGPGSDLDFSFIAFGDMGESERRGRKSPMWVVATAGMPHELAC